MKKGILIILSIFFLSMSLFGCAGNPNPASEATEKSKPAGNTASDKLIEPELLISKAEAEELIGEAMMDAEKTETEVVGNKMGFYESADENSERFLQVSITQQAFIPNPEITPRSLFNSIKNNFAAELEEVDGIGDEAFIATPGIHIMSEDCYIVIGVGNTSNEANRGILKAAGQIAVDNLKLLNK